MAASMIVVVTVPAMIVPVMSVMMVSEQPGAREVDGQPDHGHHNRLVEADRNRAPDAGDALDADQGSDHGEDDRAGEPGQFAQLPGSEREATRSADRARTGGRTGRPARRWRAPPCAWTCAARPRSAPSTRTPRRQRSQPPSWRRSARRRAMSGARCGHAGDPGTRARAACQSSPCPDRYRLGRGRAATQGRPTPARERRPADRPERLSRRPARLGTKVWLLRAGFDALCEMQHSSGAGRGVRSSQTGRRVRTMTMTIFDPRTGRMVTIKVPDKRR